MTTRRAAQSVKLPDEQFNAIARAVADPRRFAILQQVAAADSITCGALNEHQVISPATVSHHLKELAEAGLVEMQREGRYANITLCRPVWTAYCKRLAAL